MGGLVGYRAWALGAVFALHLIYSLIKLKSQLHMLQLNGYFTARYLAWCRRNVLALWCVQDFEPGIALLGIWLLSPDLVLIIWLLVYSKLLLSYQPRRHAAKKKLRLTPRMWRLLIVLSLLWLTGYAVGWQWWRAAKNDDYLLNTLWLLTGFWLAMPLLVMVSNWLLRPVEYCISRYYLRAAQRQLAAYPALKRIAITGSFGKTTTKYILATLLESRFLTLKTPGSCNTLMGVTKVIREKLKPIHQCFIVELGARLPGDIRQLCQLVKPTYGVITAIGEQHLAYFKTLARIQQTKYELIEALPAGIGVAFFNLDDLHSAALIAQTQQAKKVRVVTFALQNPAANYCLTEIQTSVRGSSFRLLIDGHEQKPRFSTVLLGRTTLYDVVAALAVASELGMSVSQLAAVLPLVPPVPHRLEIKTGRGGTILIDDSYSANPVGARQALDVLAAVATTKRKIIVTPGMIELGQREEEHNRELAKYMGKIGDYIIIVGQPGRKGLRQGLEEINYPVDRYFLAKNFAAAQAHLAQITQPGDVVLFENDLTDDYEK